MSISNHSWLSPRLDLLFSPIDLPDLLLSTNTLPSLLFCVRLCHSTVQCRIFDYDPSSRQCRLFEGDIATMGSIIPSAASTQSLVGSMKIDGSQFVSHGQGCSSCVGSRYLECVNNTCQCPTKTFFDGSICRSEQLAGDPCLDSSECRGDLNYTCQLNMTCGGKCSSSFLRFLMQWFWLVEGSPPAAAIVVGGLVDGNSGGNLSALSSPLGIALGSDQSLYVADSGNHRVIKLPAGSLTGKVVAGTGTAGSSLNQLNGPRGIHVDPSLNVYVLDANNYRVMLWLRNASVGILAAGTGSSGSTLSSFSSADSLYVDSQGYIFVSDTNNHRVLRWAPNTTNAVIVAGTGVTGGDNQKLNHPYGIDFDEANSHLYVADYGNNRIQRFTVGVSINGTTVAGGNGLGSEANQFIFPYSAYASRTSNYIYVADWGNGRIQQWMPQAVNGTTIVGFGATNPNYSSQILSPVDLKLSFNDAFLFICDSNGNRVWRFKMI